MYGSQAVRNARNFSRLEKSVPNPVVHRSREKWPIESADGGGTEAAVQRFGKKDPAERGGSRSVTSRERIFATTLLAGREGFRTGRTVG